MTNEDIIHEALTLYAQWSNAMYKTALVWGDTEAVESNLIKKNHAEQLLATFKETTSC